MSNDLISRKETERLLRAYADDVCMRPNENALAIGICKAACFVMDENAVPAADRYREAMEKLGKIERIVNMQLIAGKNKYKEINRCFYEIAEIIQKS